MTTEIAHEKRPDSTAKSRMRRYRQREGDISIPEYEMSDRRKACADDHVLFLQTYLIEWFYAPFCQDHLDSLADIRNLYLKGRDFADGEPRGTGKSVRFRGMGMWAILYGYTRYNTLIGATSGKAKKLMEFVTQQFASNELLAEDWPDICLPIREAWHKPNRSRYLTVNGEPSLLTCSTHKLVLPAVRCCIDGPDIYSSVFECHGLKEASRGLSHQTASGKIIRPNIATIDDPQTDRGAKSETQRQEVMDLFRQAIKGMGGFNNKIAVGIACTVIRKGDAADQMLDRKKNPDLHGVRKKFVKRFPACSRFGMEQRGIEYNAEKDWWARYMEMRRQDKAQGGNGEPATEMYLRDRAIADEDSEVLWEYAFDSSKGEHSALQSAFNFIADNGEAAFFAELQNDPLEVKTMNVRLTADQVMERANGLPPYTVPRDAQFLTVFIDWNHHALSWCAAAFKPDLSGAVIAYDEWGRNGNIGTAGIGTTERSDRIWNTAKPASEGIKVSYWNAMNALASWLFTPNRFTRDGRGVPINLCLIDMGYVLEAGDRTLIDWCYQWTQPPHNGYGVMPCRGWSAEKFPTKPNARVSKQSIEAWWRTEADATNAEVKILHFDAPFHRRQMQEAWFLAPGSPGSLMLNGTAAANGKAITHLQFALQVSAEKLAFFAPPERPGVSGVYQFASTPGIRKEMGDCVSGCRLAAWTLIGDSTRVSILGTPTHGSALPLPVTPTGDSHNQPSDAPLSTAPPTAPPVRPVPRHDPRVIMPDQSGWHNWPRR